MLESLEEFRHLTAILSVIFWKCQQVFMRLTAKLQSALWARGGIPRGDAARAKAHSAFK